MSADERVAKEDQIECKELGKRKEGEESSVERVDWESDKSRTEVNDQEER